MGIAILALLTVIIFLLIVIVVIGIYMISEKEEIEDNVEDKNRIDPLIDELQKDRDYLLLYMARSFSAADKLVIEKKHPNADHVILVFQVKNGNLRFSLKEDLLPDSLRTPTVHISKDRINMKTNYKLIDEIVNQKD
jgi:hypothetical protein